MAANAEPVTNPFTVLVDSAESQPWTFQGLRCDADKKLLPLAVPYRFANLGRHPHSLGDYTIDGCHGEVAIERKSMEDAISTVLGWNSDYEIERGRDGRRARFKRELANLRAIHSAVVIVEATLEAILARMPGCDGDDYVDEGGECNPTRGVKRVAENRKIFFRSVVSWQQRPELRVPWMFCSSRRAAEVFAFRYLEKYWQHLTKRERADARKARAV